MLRRFLTFALLASAPHALFAQQWQCYGGNPQHTGIFTGTSQSASQIRWQASLDDNRSYYGDEVLIHYASPMITSGNTVVHGYRYTSTGSGAEQYDHWSVIARTGSTGAQLWRLDTDYSAEAIFPNDWTSVYPLTLYALGRSPAGVAAAGGGGSVMIRPQADQASASATRLVFYTTVSDYNSNAAAYAPIKICTPLTSDAQANIYFGYIVTGSVPSNVSNLGTGGVVKVNAITGAATFKSVQSLGIDSSLNNPAYNAAPALSNDGSSIYVALTGGKGMLAKLSTSNLATEASVELLDPSIPGAEAYLISESSASPMVGPDGHVFMGVFGNQWRESHGWMLQFDGNLSQTGANGQTYPVGAFGWDDTPSVVPSTMVPTYRGRSTYLICTKYNNYDDDGSDPGADGSNKIAVLDPSSNLITHDRQSGIPVMTEVLTVLSPEKTNNDPNHPDARYEWCINSVAVDVNRQSVIINCEDGHMYRWSLVTNTIVEALDLQPATGEAYTSTEIGPDGQIYATNNSILEAIGSPQATAVSVFEGTPGIGTVQDIWYMDGLTYSTGSVGTAGGQQAAIEADFTLTTVSPTYFSVTASASAVAGATAFVYAYNYTTHQFDELSAKPFSGTQTALSATVTSNAAAYVGPGGAVRVLVRGFLPVRQIAARFFLAADLITCGAG